MRYLGIIIMVAKMMIKIDGVKETRRRDRIGTYCRYSCGWMVGIYYGTKYLSSF